MPEVIRTLLLVIFVPLWGALCAFILHFRIFIETERSKKIDVEKMRIDADVYRSISAENPEAQKEIIPLEEALIVNDVKIRRNLMMDVLNNHPEEYMELLDQARMNEDAEVVHYAATAMAELSKQYDYELQKIEKRYSAAPDSVEILEEYCEFLRNYISQGLAKGKIEIVQRNQYSELLKKKLLREETQDVYVRLAENQIYLKDYTEAAESLRRIEEKWPESGEYWMLRIKYCVLQKCGKDMRAVLAEMKQKKIYLSAENKEQIHFWKQNLEVEEENK